MERTINGILLDEFTLLKFLSGEVTSEHEYAGIFYILSLDLSEYFLYDYINGEESDPILFEEEEEENEIKSAKKKTKMDELGLIKKLYPLSVNKLDLSVIESFKRFSYLGRDFMRRKGHLNQNILWRLAFAESNKLLYLTSEKNYQIVQILCKDAEEGPNGKIDLNIHCNFIK